MSLVLPRFQAQNPEISGYAEGWSSCQAFAGAMTAAFDHQVPIVMTGGALRNKTGDHTGGLNLSQIDSALERGWPSVSFQVRYRVPFATVEKMVDAGIGVSLSVYYRPISQTRFDAGRGFTGNHQLFLPPGWGAMEPLADGRYGEAYKYRGEAYPRSLLRIAAGELNLSTTGYTPLGQGLAYIGFTRDRLIDYKLAFDGGESFWVYRVANGRILDGRKGRYAKKFSADTSARCTVGSKFLWNITPDQTVTRILVRMLNGALAGEYVAIPQAAVHLEVA